MREALADEDLRAAVAANPRWYHSIELSSGVVTPGAFDLRPIADRLPWPEVEGRRCLDVGARDGFLAFQLERRGAREVVAVEVAGDRGRGFELAKQALGSRVERLFLSVHDLSPERLGMFDVVTCGSLLLHMRDPVRALEAIRGVCSGWLLSADHVDLRLTLRHPRRPVARLGSGDLAHWWIPNAAGHRRMLEAAGFEVARSTRPYAVPFGAGHPPRRGLRTLASAALTRAVTGSAGVPHVAALARPRV